MGVAPLNPRETAAWHAFLRAHAVVMRKLEAELQAEHGLSLPAYEVLAHLSESPDGRLRMSDLAECASLTPSGLTRLVDKLVSDGFVERRRDQADARVVYAILLEEGRRRLAAAWPTHLRGVRQHLIDRLSEDELDSISAPLARLLEECPAPPPMSDSE